MKLYLIKDKIGHSFNFYKNGILLGFYKIVSKPLSTDLYSGVSKFSMVQVLKNDGSKCGSLSNYITCKEDDLIDASEFIETEIKELETKLKFLKNIKRKINKIENESK